MDNKTLSNMKDEPQTSTIYYGVYTPNDIKDYNATPNVFEDKIEALKVAKKNKKSRFKAFHFYHEAVEFALNGSEFPNNTALNISSTNKSTDSTNTVGEKSSPFKGPKPQELVELRKQIENGHFKVVKDTIWQNPRYLVSSGDTPAILQEGPRYNALHVAAKSKNAEITELILNTISNPEFVKLLNGDDNQLNAEYRTSVLLDLYLNTPNKGLNETPLHFASKHGAVEVVEILVSYPQCDKTLKNKFQKTAAQIICERADGENISAAKKAIETLLQESYYVPVLRAEDECMPPLIGEPFSPSSPPVINSDPLSPQLEIHAYAGPMDKKEAQHFRKVWKTPPRSLNYSLPGSKSMELNLASLKYRDPKKGLERIGKRLANTYEVNWKEYWPFLDSFIDLSSEEGLNSLETYIKDRNALLNISMVEEVKKSSDLNVSDPLSPISNLCQAFSSCRLNDSTRSNNSSDDQKYDIDSINYIDKACRVFANRISNDILYILCSEDNILQILETEVKQLELLMASYMDDSRFSMINFQKIHSRLGILVGQKLYNNLKENVRVFLCGKLGTMFDSLTKSIDCFSSDDESHILDVSETRKPTIYKRQLVCLLHFILNVLTQNFECKQGTEDAGCVKDWDKAEPCTCVYHSRKSKRNNSVSRSNSFKNGSKLFQTSAFDSLPRRLSFNETDANPDCVLNGFNVSSFKNSTDSSSDDESGDMEDKFYTPPSSPSFLNSDSESEDEFMDSQLPKHEVFLEGENPTKLDCEVFNALCYSEVKLDHKKYPNIYKWYHTISLYSEEERESWMSYKDQQKVNKFFPNTSVNVNFNLDSPRTSTPSKSWFRVTGANSPKSALRSRSLIF